MLKIESLKGVGVIKSTVLEDAVYLEKKDQIDVGIPIMNGAYAGELDTGMKSGITMIAGESKTFKTMLALLSVKAYMDTYKDAICLFYDNEFGTNKNMISNIGVDTKKILHLPMSTIENFGQDLSQKLDAIEYGDKVVILVDSLGMLASDKELTDAETGDGKKNPVDMTRAKAMNSFFRIITPKISIKDIPMIAINHTYQTMSQYEADVISGGSKTIYAPDSIFIIGKAQEKEGAKKEYVGNKFTINIHKSRTVKEKSKFPFIVKFKGGLNKWTGLFDVALELGVINKVNNVSYILVDDNGEVIVDNFKRSSKEEDDDFWETVFTKTSFKQKFKKRYQYENLFQDEKIPVIEEDDAA